MAMWQAATSRIFAGILLLPMANAAPRKAEIAAFSRAWALSSKRAQHTPKGADFLCRPARLGQQCAQGAAHGWFAIGQMEIAGALEHRAELAEHALQLVLRRRRIELSRGRRRKP